MWLQVGVAPHSDPHKASGGQGGNASGSFRRAAPARSRGVGGLEPANRHCAGMARMPHSRQFAGMRAGPVASKQAKNMLRGRSPGPGPIARSFPRPIPAARPGANAAVWRCDRHGDRGQLPGVDPGRGPRPRAAWSSREACRLQAEWAPLWETSGYHLSGCGADCSTTLGIKPVRRLDSRPLRDCRADQGRIDSLSGPGPMFR